MESVSQHIERVIGWNRVGILMVVRSGGGINVDDY